MVAQSWLSNGQKWLEMGQNGGYRPISEKVFTQSDLNSWCTLAGWVFRNDYLLGNDGQILALKWLQNDFKLVKVLVPHLYLKKLFTQSNSKTGCIHWLCEWSEMRCFLATLAKFWPSSGHKITENGSFQSLSEKVFMQTNSKLVCTLIRWVFRNDPFFGYFGQLLGL